MSLNAWHDFETIPDFNHRVNGSDKKTSRKETSIAQQQVQNFIYRFGENMLYKETHGDDAT